MLQELKWQRTNNLQKGLQAIAAKKTRGVFFIAGTGGKPQSWFVPTMEFRFTTGCLSENRVLLIPRRSDGQGNWVAVKGFGKVWWG